MRVKKNDRLMVKSNPFEIPSYKGDSLYSINSTGDAVVGDKVRFERAIFSGNFKKPKFERFELITGEIIKDSYGADKQQHTFTLLLPDGEKMLIKGRNLYGNGLWRKPWINENERKEALDEKHRRGNMARTMKRERIGMNPIVRRGNKLEKELESYEPLFERNKKDPRIDSNELSEHEKMLSYSEKQNPRGVASITTKKLQEIMDEPFKRGKHGADFEAKYGLEDIENEYYKRMAKKEEKKIKEQLREEEEFNQVKNKKEKTQIEGEILWWSERNGNGIIIDRSGNEYYIDRSVLSKTQEQKLSRGVKVSFSPKRLQPENLLTAKNIKILEKTQKKQLSITLNWEIYESLKETYAFLELPDFPFYNVRIYFGNFFTVYVSDGYKTFKEKDFKSLYEAVVFAENEFLKLVMKDEEYDVYIGRIVK